MESPDGEPEAKKLAESPAEKNGDEPQPASTTVDGQDSTVEAAQNDGKYRKGVNVGGNMGGVRSCWRGYWLADSSTYLLYSHHLHHHLCAYFQIPVANPLRKVPCPAPYPRSPLPVWWLPPENP